MKRLLLLLPFMTLLACVASAQINNPDFETWTAGSYSTPDSNWYTSNPISVSRLGIPNDSANVGANATPHGIKLQTLITTSPADTQIAYISNTPYNPFSGLGGQPYSSLVTQLTGYFKNYEFQNNDTSILIVYFKKAGAVISRDTLKFGGSNPNWTFFTKNLHLGTSVTPDSVIIAAISSNILLNGGIGASWLALDQLAFAGLSSVQPIVGGTFDGAAKTINTNTPNNWSSEGGGLFGSGISQAAPGQHANYAIQLVTSPSGGGQGGLFPAPAAVSSGMPMHGGGSIPVTGLPYSYSGADTLMGYYKYTPIGNDSGVVTVTLIKNGLPVGVPYSFYASANASYTQFKLGWGTPSLTPDSIRIDIASSHLAAKPGSTFIVDNLSLKSQGSSAVNNVYFATNNITVYPNPANSTLNVHFNEPSNGNVNVRLYDVTGKTMFEKEYGSTSGTLNIPVSQLPSGMYFYEVRDNSFISRSKFIKE